MNNYPGFRKTATYYVDEINELKRQLEIFQSEAWLLRKQAEAVEGANDSLRNEINNMPGTTLSVKERSLLNGALRHLEQYAQRLRQQANELEGNS